MIGRMLASWGLSLAGAKWAGPMGKKKQDSLFIGSWRIVSMSEWEDEYLHEEVTAFIEFDDRGSGEFQFGYVRGYMDWRSATRGGEAAAEWSWEGGDGADCTPLTGRGWAILKGDELNGMIFIHQGDDFEFVARRSRKRKRAKKK
jgi:hypothetical protein